MTGLLIHSVSEFSDLILEALRLSDAQDIVEIGAEYGGMSTLLANHCRGRGGRFTSVDPAPKRELSSPHTSATLAHQSSYIPAQKK